MEAEGIVMKAAECIVIEPKLKARECVFGDKGFYQKLLMIVVPMILQNTLTNIVNLLDNVMVGRVGTLPMSAVAIDNQLMFVFFICVWGGIAGAGIYGAQFFGKGDMEGVRNSFRIKLLIAGTMVTAALLIFGFAGTELASLYVAADTPMAERMETLGYARDYLHVMMVGLLPFGLTQCYGGTMRESGRTTLPMIASMAAMVVNFIFNILLIFGYLGFPKMGVVGAAVATVISRFVELAIVMIGAHTSPNYAFMKGIYKTMKIPLELLKQVMSKALPLLMNETLWALGESTVLQLYSVRGIQAIAAMNICNTIAQIFNEVFLSMGNAAGIVVGQELGAARFRDAVRSAWRIVFSSMFCCVIMGALLCLCSPYIPRLYNTEPEIKLLATSLILVSGIVMPLRGMTNATYFTLRSGGKTWITLIFDSIFSWCIIIPTGYVIAHMTSIPLVYFYAIIAGMETIKCVIGVIMLKSRTWVANIVTGV